MFVPVVLLDVGNYTMARPLPRIIAVSFFVLLYVSVQVHPLVEETLYLNRPFYVNKCVVAVTGTPVSKRIPTTGMRAEVAIWAVW